MQSKKRINIYIKVTKYDLKRPEKFILYDLLLINSGILGNRLYVLNYMRFCSEQRLQQLK